MTITAGRGGGGAPPPPPLRLSLPMMLFEEFMQDNVLTTHFCISEGGPRLVIPIVSELLGTTLFGFGRLEIYLQESGAQCAMASLTPSLKPKLMLPVDNWGFHPQQDTAMPRF